MPLEDLKKSLSAIIGKTAEGLFDLPDGPPAFDLSPSAEPKFGHFACNLALQLAGPLKRSPRQIGEALAGELEKVFGDLVERIEVAGPGFLNFHLAAGAQAEPVKSILAEEKPFLWPAEKPLKINLEYVSANPTGPLLVVNGRAAALGSALAKILVSVGHQVTEEYFVNDAGSQVVEFGKSVFRENRDKYRKAGYEIPNNVYDLGNEGGYAGDTTSDVADTVYKSFIEEYMATTRKMIFDEKAYIDEVNNSVVAQLEKQQITLKRFGCLFQQFYKEHYLYFPSVRPSYRSVLENYILNDELYIERLPGPIRDALYLLKELRIAYESEGAVWLRTTDYGDEKDRVIVRSNGKPTYLLTDIAYHLDKWERLGGDESGRLMIDIWGPDHHGHILPTKAGLQAAGIPPDRLEVLISGWVTLKRGGEIVSMSKRKGNIVTLDELLDEVGVDVARYMFLERSPEAHLDFDLDLAVQQSSENPAYYIQYAHARIESIFSVAREEGFSEDELGDASLAEADLTPLFTDDDAGERQRELLRQIIFYPGVVAGAAAGYAPQRVTAYLHNLAGVFHPYYKKVKVLVEERGTALARLALCRSLQKILAHGLGLLGISAPESM
ncbi:MAG TPA: arginine--tRNA ligase [bacterium]|nr:arginine--tRNA ligase [bacterium]